MAAGLTWFGDEDIDRALRGEPEPGEAAVITAMQPPKLQLVFSDPNGVRPAHQTFNGAIVDPDVDPWAGENNEPPSGERATITRLGG